MGCDSYSCVNHLHLKISLIVICMNYLYFSFNLAFLCEFESIRLETKQNLHDPVLVTVYRLIVLIDIFELYNEIDLFVVGFLSLDAHHIFNAFFDIELLVVLTELI